jgi:hypothetical protein
MFSWLNNYLLEAWLALPKLPAWSVHAMFLIAFAINLPAFFYGQRLAEKAEKEGRAEKFMGMYTNPMIMREMFREARNGNNLAKAMLWLQFLSIPAVLLVFFWPRQSAGLQH